MYERAYEVFKRECEPDDVMAAEALVSVGASHQRTHCPTAPTSSPSPSSLHAAGLPTISYDIAKLMSVRPSVGLFGSPTLSVALPVGRPSSIPSARHNTLIAVAASPARVVPGGDDGGVRVCVHACVCARACH